jgi:predicted ATPase
MGLHTGQGVLGGDDYIGIDVNTAARIAGLAHGEQVLLSAATRALVQHNLPDGVSLRYLGDHRLKDIAHTERLYDLVIDGLRNAFPPVRSLDVRPNNLPLQLTSFVGRADEIVRTAQLLAVHRLVTMTGTGGSGKTRLALQVAAQVLPQFDDGVFFVDLAPLSDHAQVPSAITQALGIMEQSGRELIDTLDDWLADKDVLLMLDNFEHVAPAAWVAERLLGSAPRLRILVTSRAPLRLYGEQEHQVPPLALPDLSQPHELEALYRNEAIALFVDRARAVDSGFGLTDQNARIVGDVCARLDGLPLAIELAASRIKVLSPQAVLSRLATGPDVLTATALNLPPRQRTLRATIDWSCGLLAEPERRLFSRLSVFRGGADLDAVEAVGNPRHDLGVHTLHALSALVDHSLVRRIELPGGELRFGMLETIREFAGELLTAGGDDEAATQRRHAAYFLTLAHEGEPHLTADDQVQWLNRFEHEHANLQAAFQWTIDAGEPERGMAAAATMWRFWHQRNYLSVGRSWLERLLPFAHEQTASVAKAELAAGSIAYWQMDYEATERHYQKALEISQALDDRPGIAEATYDLAFVPERGEGSRGELEWRIGGGSIEQMHDAMQRFEELGDLAGVAKSKKSLALFLAGTGGVTSAAPLLEEAISVFRTLGDRFQLTDALMAYGIGLLLMGDHAGAREHVVEALGMAHEADVWAGVEGALEALSSIESAQGKHERALRLLGVTEVIRRSIEGGYPLHGTNVTGIDVLSEGRKAIGDEAVDRALAEGRSMSRAEAVAYATESE